MNSYLVLSPEVENARAENAPVVALESTIIAHGMPWPRNVETALAVEKIVRDAGAVPATCAVIDGKMKAGLSVEEIERIGRGGKGVPKASRRDMGYLLSTGATGATTVASTMIIAHSAGIRIFATGGIGGVHRGGAQTLDISADLQELAHTPVAVVCAGAKSILDLPLTLEYLETFGVPVVGYQTEEFPAFYTRKSGLKTDFRLDSPEAVAKLLTAHWGAGLRGGAVIANPIPEEYQADPEEIAVVIEAALAEAERTGIKGKAVSPFLLAKIEVLSGGKSLEANIQLVYNNVRLGAEIAAAMEGASG